MTTAPTPTAPPADPASRATGGTTAPVGGSTGAGADGPRAPVASSRHRLRYVVVGLVLVGALAFLLVKGLSTALDFYLPVDQAVHQEASLGSKTVNLEGVVQPGSIHPTPTGVDFTVGAGGTTLAVENTGSPPQLFQANIPVIAVGHFEGGTFVSTQILVKHSSTYIAQHPNRVTAPNGTKR